MAPTAMAPNSSLPGAGVVGRGDALCTQASAKPLRFQPATRDRFPDVVGLLHRAGYSTCGIHERLDDFVIGLCGWRVVAVAGAERAGQIAQLRWLAIHDGWRGCGVREPLLDFATQHLRRRGAARIEHGFD